FFTRDLLCYVAVDVFGYHHSYSLVHIAKHWWKWVQLRYICAMDSFPTIDTSHIRVAHLPRTATLRRHIFIALLTSL
ncbi:hypothetical protein SFRURICE_019849, partial [Spodoptera frugiperda]